MQTPYFRLCHFHPHLPEKSPCRLSSAWTHHQTSLQDLSRRSSYQQMSTCFWVPQRKKLRVFLWSTPHTRMLRRRFFHPDFLRPPCHLRLTLHRHKGYCSTARHCKKSCLRSSRKWPASSDAMPSISQPRSLQTKRCCVAQKRRLVQTTM